MKKNDVFTFTSPNGEEVTGVVIMEWPVDTPIIYAQNRIAFFNCDENHIGGVLVDYAILPDYDELLARYNDIKAAQAETAAGM